MTCAAKVETKGGSVKAGEMGDMLVGSMADGGHWQSALGCEKWAVVIGRIDAPWGRELRASVAINSRMPWGSRAVGGTVVIW